MADESSIIINIKAQSDIDEATKQVAEMLKSARDLAAQSGKLQQSNQGLSSSFQQEATAAKKSVESLREATKQENMLTGAATNMKKELREVSIRLQELADSGDTTSAEFTMLAEKAANMTDTMGDTQSIIRILASDTKNLDTALAVGGGLTGAFNAATSAVALLGGESEELNKAFLKVQAALAILNGLQQVGNVLNERSAANVVLRAALTKIFTREKVKEATAESAAAAAAVADTTAKGAETTATIAATTATNAFTAALLANPVGAIIALVAALAAGIVILTKHFKDAAVEARGYAAELERLEKLTKNIDKDTTYAAAVAEAEGKGWRDVIQIQRDGANRRLALAQETMDRLRQKQKETHEELTEEEQEYLKNAIDMEQKAWDDLMALDDRYTIKEIEEKRKNEEEKTAKAKEAAKKRAEEELKAYQEAFDAKMQADKEAADEKDAIAIYEMKKRQEEIKAEKDRQQMLIDLAAQEAEEEMAYSDEVAEHDIENYEKVKEKQIEKYQEAMEIAQITLQSIADLTSEIFGMFGDQIDSELDSLQNLYTTDAKEAQENSKKKYITEEEYQKKEAALKLKQAKLDKANSAFQIGLSTAMAIMRIWADVPKTDFGAATIALTASTAALGAVQLAAALAKPLPQYAKGRKGGEGEYALVGERGAEIMYVPSGASIIPHNKIGNPAAWGAYGVPELPSTDNFITTMAMLSATGRIDYDRMAEAIAKHMPSQKAVSINVDRNGVSVSDGRSMHTYLNTKYSGAW